MWESASAGCSCFVDMNSIEPDAGQDDYAAVGMAQTSGHLGL